MGEEREAARNLKRHLTDKAGLCIVDCVRIAREVAKSAPGEEVSRQCKALEGLQNEITSTAELLRLIAPVLSELEHSLDVAQNSALNIASTHAALFTTDQSGTNR